MKSIVKIASVAMLATFSFSSALAGRIKLIDGSLDPIKGQTEFNIEFDYSETRVGKFDKEADYVSEKVAAYNKKEAGKGDSWAKAWVADRKNRYEPAFIEKFEDVSKFSITKKPAKYTMIFKTLFTEPGYNIYVSRKYADIDAEIWIVETADHSKVVAKINCENNPGRTYGGNDYDAGERISESYEYAGKYFGKFLKKELE